MRESARHLSALRRSIAGIAFQEPLAASCFTLGHEGVDGALGGGLARGRLHELFAAEEDDAGAAAGFALMLALRARRPGSAVLWLRTEAAERRSGRLYAPGMAELGLDPNHLVLGVLPDEVALLRSAVDGVRCTDLGVAVIECRGNPKALDLTASRRLSVAAEKSGVTALMLRIDAEPVPSAADTRWSVRSAESLALEANAPGHTMIEIELLRRRAGPAGMRWCVEWDRDQCIFRDPALSGAVVPMSSGGPAADRPAEPERLSA